MSQPLRLGVAGLGTVGCGLLRLMDVHAARLAETAGRPIVIAGVSARARDKARGVALGAIPWFSDPVALATDRSIDILPAGDGRGPGAPVAFLFGPHAGAILHVAGLAQGPDLLEVLFRRVVAREATLMRRKRPASALTRLVPWTA